MNVSSVPIVSNVFKDDNNDPLRRGSMKRQFTLRILMKFGEFVSAHEKQRMKKPSEANSLGG
ncbi:hypothetical protein [Planctomycetes bacterium SV_7m_r]|uniref:hypothetical protein n=1 Tax=Stieleria bergensis TaxID=2528025 RepID=UPI0011A98A4A